MLTFNGIIELASEPLTVDEQKMLHSFDNIRCLLVEKEALSLYRLCKLLPDSGRVLEIGSYQGTSAVAMGYAVLGSDIELYCLDPWSDYVKQSDFDKLNEEEVIDDFDVIKKFITNTAFIGENLRMLRGKSSVFAGLLEGKNFDLIFIDGAHDYASVCCDIKIAFSALRPGGIICGHDYHVLSNGVVLAVDEMIKALPGISVKGTIKGTSIWVAIVEEPYYEYMMVLIKDAMMASRYEEALSLTRDAYKKYKKYELLEYLSTIKTLLFIQKTVPDGVEPS